MKAFKFHVTDSHPKFDLGEFSSLKAAVEAMYAREGSHFFTWYHIVVKTLAGTPILGLQCHHIFGWVTATTREAEEKYGFYLQEHLDSLKEVV